MLKNPSDYLDNERQQHFYYAIDLLSGMAKGILKEFPEYNRISIVASSDYHEGTLSNDDGCVAHTVTEDHTFDYACAWGDMNDNG